MQGTCAALSSFSACIIVVLGKRESEKAHMDEKKCINLKYELRIYEERERARKSERELAKRQ